MVDQRYPGRPHQTAAADLDRRAFLKRGASTALGGLCTSGLAVLAQGCGEAAPVDGHRDSTAPPPPMPPSPVVVARAASYEVDLVAIIRSGLVELGVSESWVRNRTVMLKPNLVEPIPDSPHVNTHPAFIHAVAEVFLGWDARRVYVAEGPGHCRDINLVLDETGFSTMLRDSGLPFVDLNHDAVMEVKNAAGYTRLPTLHLPRILREVEILVSVPKLKTHHWALATLSMKNLFGILPGVYYGWPKNVLHYRGIHSSIVDINATVRPSLAIIDGIIGMEGDGPIMGTPRHAGVIVMGKNLPAVDATAARLMKIDPRAVPYLQEAGRFLGPIDEALITQRGERVADLAQPFELLDLPHFANARLPG